MSQLVARDLTTKIARAANYDGPSLSIGPSDNSLARMNARNGSHGLHLDPQNFEIWGFSGFRPDADTRDGLKSVLRVGGPIFGKATKVAINATMVRSSCSGRIEGIGRLDICRRTRFQSMAD